MAEVKWMIRCRHFSHDVLIRAEDEPSWMSYRYHISQARAGRVLRIGITYLHRIGLLKDDKWAKWIQA